MAIFGLTDKKGSFIRLGKIRKGEKDDKGNPKDLDYFRTTFENGCEDVEAAFLATYGLKPTRINARLPFAEVRRVWDAFYVCYGKGGQYARAGSDENGLYWVWYRDYSTGEIWVRDGRPLCPEGEELMAKRIDLLAPVYTTQGGNPAFLQMEGCLKIVIPELAQVDGKNRYGFFEFHPISPRDIGTISSELDGIREKAEDVGKEIKDIPLILSRRKEMVAKNIKGVISRGPAWVVHIEVDGSWAGKALEYTDRKALPGGDIVEGDVTELISDPEGFAEEEDEFPDYRTEPAAPPSQELPKPSYKPTAAKQFVEEMEAPAQPASIDPPFTPHEVPAASSVPGTRPYPPDVFKAKLNEIINGMPAAYAKANKPLVLTPPNIGNVLAKIIDGIFNGDKGVSRHIVCAWLIGTGSTKDMSPAQVRALFKVLEIKYDDQHTPEFDSAPSAVSMDEFRMALEQAKKELNAQPKEAGEIPF